MLNGRLTLQIHLAGAGWTCPDCGYHNDPGDPVCAGCAAVSGFPD